MIKPISSIPVFFRPEMAADAGSYSPSAGKPPLVVADWQAHGMPVTVRSFEAVNEATLTLAHDANYVRDILAGRIANGFGNRSRAVAATLTYTSGAMLAAARAAIASGRVACAPVSGFHHAGYAGGGGFCTFNGLMITALALKREGRVSRIGILDLDQHWGDGTHDIIRHLGLDWVSHHSPGPEVPSATDATRYLRRLPGIMGSFHDCDLLLYQAGADAHVDDPLGGWMTSEQLAERDRIVFDIAATVGVPVAWNLAGGYQRSADGGIEPVLAIHRRTMEACARVFVAGSEVSR